MSAATDSVRNVTDGFASAFPVAWIEASPLNPRKRFDETALAELAESLMAHGMIEPVVVRHLVEIRDNTELERYELVAGERRWRAAQLAGLATIPARVLEDVDDTTALRLALVENLQRVDLDPIEEAEGYRQLNRVVGLKQSEIAAAVRKSQPAVANAMRLLELPEDVQERIRTGQLSPSHGVALARFTAFPALASALGEIAVERGLRTHDLEKKLPTTFELERRGLVHRVDGAQGIDAKICRTRCPHGAYRHVDTWPHEFCLRPDHFAELKSAALASMAAARADRLEAATAEGAALVAIADLDWRTYERIYPGQSLPPGCTEACVCRQTGLERDGRTTPICVDPKRLGRFQAAVTRAANRELRERQRGMAELLTARLDALTEITSRELAPLVVPLLRGMRPELLEEVRARQGAAISPNWWAYEWRYTAQQYEGVAGVEPLALLKFALEVLLRREIEDEVDRVKRVAMWYLDLDEPTETAEAGS